MYRLCVKGHFDAAHFLSGYKGDCAKLHGHRWVIEIFLTFDTLDEMGMGMDFKRIKLALKKHLPDHQYLNNLYEFNPTAENLAFYLFMKLKEQFNSLERVRLWESPECYVEYYEDGLDQL